jgi:hypothetical protein
LAQIFPKWLNWLALVAGVGKVAAVVLAVGAVWYFGSPEYTDVGYRPHQPVEYSHKLHAGDLGIDCRYCHFSVESSPVAVVPPTQTCMNCHKVVKRDSEKLAVVRESAATGRPIRWVRVHELPDYAYFNHSVHVRAGVGCVSCHGRVDQMEEVMQAEPLSMSWCLDCHRNPAPHLRPTEEVFNMEWFPSRDHAEFAQRMIDEKRLEPPVDCSGCHR